MRPVSYCACACSILVHSVKVHISSLQHGKPVSPPNNEMCVSWNLMAPSNDSSSYSNMKVLRAWTTQLDPAHPQNYFLNFVKFTATVTYTPTLVQDYDSAISLKVEKAY